MSDNRAFTPVLEIWCVGRDSNPHCLPAERSAYRYLGGGAWPRDGVVVYDRKTGELYEADTSPNSGPARGEFDPEGNYWAAGRGGSLIKFDIKEKRVHEYPLPTPYTSLYTAKADKNGEVWAGELNGGRYLRFDPKTEQFTA